MDKIRIYCDESCHLENDLSPVMVVGGMWTNAENPKTIFEELRALKKQYGISPRAELKWTKVSSSKIDYYKALIDYFVQHPNLGFRAVVIPDKGRLNHSAFNQDHDTWYYKIYHLMLRELIHKNCEYQIYLDIKDSKSQEKMEKLKSFLCLKEDSCTKINKVQLIRSHEVELCQLADFFIGAVCYANRGLKSSHAKLEIVNKISGLLAPRGLNFSSARSSGKFNILIWEAREGHNAS